MGSEIEKKDPDSDVGCAAPSGRLKPCLELTTYVLTSR